MSVSRITIAALISIAVIAGYVVFGATVYRQGPNPFEAIVGGNNTTGPPGPYRGLVSGVSNATYDEWVEVEGRPGPVGHEGMWHAFTLDGLTVVLMPGEWEVEDDGTVCHWALAKQLVGAEKVKAEGYLAYWYVPGEGRTKVLVAEKVKAEGPGWELEAEHVHGSHGCMMHHGGMGPGPRAMHDHDHDEDHDHDWDWEGNG